MKITISQTGTTQRASATVGNASFTANFMGFSTEQIEKIFEAKIQKYIETNPSITEESKQIDLSFADFDPIN